MSQINFGLLQNAQNGFQNALQNGLNAGAAVGQFMQGRQEAEQRNALSQYAANPTREGLGALAQANPEYAIRERGRLDQQDAAQRQQQQADAGTMRRLLRHAGESPEGWQQAMAAGQSLGLDLSRVPQQYDPQWAQQQGLILDALSDPATATAVVNDVRAMGLDPETPEGMAAVQELTLYKYAKQTTDEYGRPTLAMPTLTMPGQQQAPAQPPAVGTIEEGYRFRGGDPASPESWEQVAQQPQMTVSPRELDALVRRFGPEEVQRRLDSGIVAVRN